MSTPVDPATTVSTEMTTAVTTKMTTAAAEMAALVSTADLAETPSSLTDDSESTAIVVVVVIVVVVSASNDDGARGNTGGSGRDGESSVVVVIITTKYTTHGDRLWLGDRGVDNDGALGNTTANTTTETAVCCKIMNIKLVNSLKKVSRTRVDSLTQYVRDYTID